MHTGNTLWNCVGTLSLSPPVSMSSGVASCWLFSSPILWLIQFRWQMEIFHLIYVMFDIVCDTEKHCLSCLILSNDIEKHSICLMCDTVQSVLCLIQFRWHRETIHLSYFWYCPDDTEKRSTCLMFNTAQPVLRVILPKWYRETIHLLMFYTVQVT